MAEREIYTGTVGTGTLRGKRDQGGIVYGKGIQTGEVEEILAEMDQLAEVPDDIMESGEDYQIVISGWQVHIPELGLNLHEGIFLQL